MRTFTFLFFVFTVALAHAQSFVFLEPNGNPAQPSYTRIAVDTIGDEFVLNCMNTTASSKNAKVRMEVLTTPGMCTNDIYFCDPIACYTASVTLSVFAFPMDAMDTTTGALIPHMSPGSCCGDYSVRYTLFDVANESDSVTVTMYYTVAGTHCTNGINELNDLVFPAYPNPASSMLTIPYRMGNSESAGWIVLYDVAGKKLGEFQLPDRNGFLNIDLSGFSDGVYFYALQTKSSLSEFKKIVILNSGR